MNPAIRARRHAAANGPRMPLAAWLLVAAGALGSRAAPAATLAVPQPQRAMHLYAGQTRLLPAPGVVRVAVGNGSVLKAVVIDRRELLLFARRAGASSLMIWNARGAVEQRPVVVYAHDTARLAHQIAAFVQGMPGVRTSIIGDQVVIQGSRLSNRDLKKIDIIAQRYASQVINFTDPMSWEKMVLIKVTMVEIPRTVLKNIGVQWNALGGGVLAGVWSPFQRLTQGGLQVNIPATGSAGLPITGVGGSGVAAPSGLNVMSLFDMGLAAQLNLLEQHGQATILAAPELSARNGSTASFLAGGKIPYTVSSISGATVHYETYGIRLAVKPEVDPEDDIDASIQVEDSSIDPSISTAAGPALLDRRMSTEFNVHSGQTIVLSGLISRSLSRSVQQVPGLGDLPILGALFRSRSFQDQQTELVVFVTPTVVTPGEAAMRSLVGQARAQIRQRLAARSDPLMPGPVLPALGPDPR